MSTSTILFVSLLFLFVTGENIHDITSAGACHLSAFVRVGDMVRWRNPTNQTLNIRGDDCHTKLDIVIPPEQSAMYVFQIRGICQYHSSACPSEVGVLNVKARIRRRSISPNGSKDKVCMALCKGTQITSADVSSVKLCGHSFDYVIRGVVDKYYNDSVELTVKQNYLHPVCQGEYTGEYNSFIDLIRQIGPINLYDL